MDLPISYAQPDNMAMLIIGLAVCVIAVNAVIEQFENRRICKLIESLSRVGWISVRRISRHPWCLMVEAAERKEGKYYNLIVYCDVLVTGRAIVEDKNFKTGMEMSNFIIKWFDELGIYLSNADCVNLDEDLEEFWN